MRFKHIDPKMMIAFLYSHLQTELPYPIVQWHRELMNLTRFQRLAVAAPRSFAKSTYFSFFYALYLVLERPGVSIQLISATGALAEKWLARIKHHIEFTQSIRDFYGDQVGDKWSNEEIHLKNGSVIMAKGAGKQIRGFRPDVVIADDLETNEIVSSKDQLDKLKKWFWTDLMGMVLADSQVIIVGTILHPESFLMDLIQYEREGWTSRLYQAVSDDWKTPLWEAQWSVEKLKQRRAEIGSACNPYEAPVLMDDWTFKPIGEVRVGDTIIGFRFGKGQRRQLVRSKVLATQNREAKTVWLSLTNGDRLRCTPDHQWFSGRYESGRRAYHPAKVGRKLQKVLTPVVGEITLEQERAYSYLGGIIDGEGACKHGSVAIAQCPRTNPETYKKIQDTLEFLKIPYSKYSNPAARVTDLFVLNGGKQVKTELINRCHLAKAPQISKVMYEHSFDFCSEKPRVQNIEEGNLETVYSLTTETGNYVVWGYASKNCFNQEYMNNPIPDHLRTFQEKWFKYYDKIPDGCVYFTTIDPAIETGELNDFTAIVTCAVDSKENLYVVEIINKRLLPSETVDAVFDCYTRWKSSVIGIEVQGFQKMLKFDLDREKRRRRDYPIIVELKSEGKRKGLRIEALQPWFEAGKVFIKKDQEELKMQLLRFPSPNCHDDIIDALAYQLNIIRPALGKATIQNPDSFDAHMERMKSKMRQQGPKGSVWGNFAIRKSL